MRIFPALTLSFALTAGCGEKPKAPENTAPTSDTVATAMPDSFAFDTTGIGVLRAEIARTDLGRDLLSFADAHDVELGYDTAACSATGITGYHKESQIGLFPGLTQDQKIITAAHELWHSRDSVVLKFKEIEASFITPNQMWNLQQYSEASGYAFGAYFLADHAHRLGRDIAVDSTSWVDIHWAKDLKKEMDGDGLSEKEYLKLAIEPAFSILGTGYAARHKGPALNKNRELARVTKVMNEVLSSGDVEAQKRLLHRLDSIERKTPGEKAFHQLLRQFCSVSLDPKVPTALASVSTEDLDHYPYSAKNATREQFGSAMIALGIEGWKRASLSHEYDSLKTEMRARIEKSAEKERAVAAVVEKLLDPAKDISRLRKMMRETQAGASLEDFCTAKNIGMNYAMTPRMMYYGEEGGYDFTSGKLTMMPGLSDEKNILTMFHEFRHGWQDKALKAFDVLEAPIVPGDKWTLLRFLEADAFAYSVYAYAERMLQKGIKTPDSEIMLLNEAPLIVGTLDHLKLKGPMTLDEYREKVFVPCLALLKNYDARQLDYIRECGADGAASLMNPTLERIDSLYHVAQQAPDKEGIEKLLRKLGGLSLDPAAPTSLQNSETVTREKLFDIYPFLSTRTPEADAARDSSLKAEGAAYDAHMQNLRTLSKSLHP